MLYLLRIKLYNKLLICFSGRLKRKGPADKAYERKRHNDNVAPDARGRAFLAGITWTRQNDTGLDDVKSTREADSVQLHGDSVSATWSKSSEQKSNTAIANGRVYRLQSRPIDDSYERTSISVQRTHLMVSRSDVDGNSGFVRLAATAQDQQLDHRRSLQDSGNMSTACAWEREPTWWNAVIDQSHHPVACRRDVDAAHRSDCSTPTSFWPNVQANYELFPGPSYPCGSAPFDNTEWSCPSSTDCWSDFETTMGNWFNTNTISDCFDSDDRCQRNNHF